MAFSRGKTILVVSLLALAPTAAVTQNLPAVKSALGIKAKTFPTPSRDSYSVSSLATFTPRAVAYGSSYTGSVVGRTLSSRGISSGKGLSQVGGAFFSSRSFSSAARGGGFARIGSLTSNFGQNRANRPATPAQAYVPPLPAAAGGENANAIVLANVPAAAPAAAAPPIAAAAVAAAVPEPATWALMLLGFGGMGALLRHARRRRPLLAG